MSVTTTSSTTMSTGESISAWRTIARGVDFSPELKEGIWLTGFFAVLATLGRVVVPIAVQQTLDRGLNGPGGPCVFFERDGEPDLFFWRVQCVDQVGELSQPSR